MPYNFSDVIKEKQSFTSMMSRLNAETSSGEVLRMTSTGEGRDKQYQIKADATPATANQSELLAATLKAAIDRQLGPGSGAEVFARANLNNGGQLRGTDLQALNTQFNALAQEVRQNLGNPDRPRVAGWREAGNAAPANSKAATESLQELAQDPNVQWRVSESGGTGALIAIKPDGNGVVIKIEPVDAVQQSVQASNALQAAYGGDNGAFEAAPVSDETHNAAGKQALRQKLQSMADTTPDARKREILLDHIANLDANDGATGVSKMGFVNGTQVNNLSLDDKVALLQTGQMARELGKMAVLCPQAQLGDHAGPMNEERANATTNLSNFMLAQQGAKLAPIDLDIKHGTAGVATGVEDLAALVQEATASRQGFENVVNKLVADAGGAGAPQTPLADCMKALTNPAANVEGLFSEQELVAVDGVVNTDAMRRQQATALLEGVIDGFDYSQQNAQRMNDGLAGPNGLSGADMGRIQTANDSIDVAQARQQLEHYSAPRRTIGERLAGAVNNARNSIGGALHEAGSEQKLRGVPQEVRERYEELKAELKGINDNGLNAVNAALDGDVAALDTHDEEQPDNLQRAQEIRTEMAQLKNDNPGLAQLDRTKIGQVVHSGLRDAAKSIGSKIRQ